MYNILHVNITVCILVGIIGMIKSNIDIKRQAENPINMFEKYKNEKYKKLKGWGVFLYLISSVFLYFYTIAKLFWVAG